MEWTPGSAYVGSFVNSLWNQKLTFLRDDIGTAKRLRATTRTRRLQVYIRTCADLISECSSYGGASLPLHVELVAQLTLSFVRNSFTEETPADSETLIAWGVYSKNLIALAQDTDASRAKLSRITAWLSRVDPPGTSLGETLPTDHDAYHLKISGINKLPWELLNMASLFYRQVIFAQLTCPSRSPLSSRFLI